MTVMATAMTATDLDDQLGEIYPTIYELNYTFGVSFHIFIAVAIMRIVTYLYLLTLYSNHFVRC